MNSQRSDLNQGNAATDHEGMMPVNQPKKKKQKHKASHGKPQHQQPGVMANLR